MRGASRMEEKLEFCQPGGSMRIIVCTALMALVPLGAITHAEDAPYRVSGRIAVGGEGGWDYPSIDPTTHLLYLSRGDRVVIVDTATGKSVGEIAGTDGVHGVALAAELNLGFISCGRSNLVKVFDLKT